jgi:hypothetical protein
MRRVAFFTVVVIVLIVLAAGAWIVDALRRPVGRMPIPQPA